MIKLRSKNLQDWREFIASPDADLFGSACFIFSWFLIGFWCLGIYFGFLDAENSLDSIPLLDGIGLFFISIFQHLLSDNFDYLFTLDESNDES